MQWVFRAFYVYYLFNHGNYGVIEYIFHLWWQHISELHVILFILFILLSHSLIILFSQLRNKYLHNGDSLSPSFRHFTGKQIKYASEKLIKHNKHFNISSRNSF